MDLGASLLRLGGPFVVACRRVLPCPRPGLRVKVLGLLAAVLIPTGALTWTISVHAVRTHVTGAAVAKGTTLATALGSLGGELTPGDDVRRLRELALRVAGMDGVAYVLVEDGARKAVAHSFTGDVPPELSGTAPASDGRPVRAMRYADRRSGAPRDVLDVSVPMASGTGTVRVGVESAGIAGAATRTSRLLLGAFAVVAVLAGVAGVGVAGHFTRRIDVLVRMADRVGRGELAVTAPVASRDELGRLAETFNDGVRRLRTLVVTEAERDAERSRREALQGGISRLLDMAVEIAHGDLTLRGEVTPDALGNVVDALNLIVEELGSLVAEVRHAAQRVADAATEMTAATDQVLAGAHAHAREVTTVTQAMATSADAARMVASSTECARTAAERALAAAGEGDAAVRDSRAGMQRIRAEVQVISRRIKGLGDRSLEISEIVDTIEEIAVHTNLLALNAAIEAAGAGDAGLRFAVVADEIRKLAERAAKATRDIASLIRAVRGETQEAVVAMESGIREVEAGYRVTLHAEESLAELARLSRVSAELAQEISTSTRGQVRGAEAVAGAMQSIAAVAVQTEQAGLQARRTVDDLVKVADELTRTLARFRLAGP